MGPFSWGLRRWWSGGDRKWEGWLVRTPCCRALHSTKGVSIKPFQNQRAGPRLLKDRLWAADRGPGGGVSSPLLAVPRLPVRCPCCERSRFLVHRPCGRSEDKLFSRWREPWPCQWSERASNCAHVMVPDFPKFPLFIAGWAKLFKVYSASSWACCEPMVLITPFPIVSDPDPWGQGFLVTQKPVLPHPVISLKKMGEQDCFLLSFDLFLPLLERFSSNKVGRQTFSSAPGPLSALEETQAAPTHHCPFPPSSLWGSGRRWKVWNMVIALLLPRLGVPEGSDLACGSPRDPSRRD